VRWTTVCLLIALAAAGLWLWLGGTPTRPPTPEPEPRPPPAPYLPPRPPPPTTGTLVIRLKMDDGTEVPAGAKAGYQRPGGPLRMRAPSPDGTFRFSDAPVGTLDIVAEANGYRTAKNTVNLDPGIPTETILTLTPAPTDR
jgi:hypothetical protein